MDIVEEEPSEMIGNGPISLAYNHVDANKDKPLTSKGSIDTMQALRTAIKRGIIGKPKPLTKDDLDGMRRFDLIF